MPSYSMISDASPDLLTQCRASIRFFRINAFLFLFLFPFQFDVH